MAVTAKFIADFSNFSSAVNAAQIQLRGFEDSAGKVGTSLNRMTDQFSGRKLIQEGTMMARVLGDAGSIARLTGNELQVAGAKAAEAAEKMRKMGVDVPPGLQRIADTAKQAAKEMKDAAAAEKRAGDSTSLLVTGIGALGGAFAATKIIGFASDLVSAAGALQDLHERTDISVEGLQRFKIIAEQSGSSIDAVAGAVFQMGRRLAGGDDSAAKAVAALGLNFEELRAMRPEDAFNAVGRALALLDDPMKRAQLGAAIFGRSVDELIPSLKHLSEETGSYIALSAGQVAFLDKLGDAFVRVKASIIPLTVSVIDHTFQISRAYAGWSALLGKIDEAPAVAGRAKAALDKMNAGVAGQALQPIGGASLDTIQREAVEQLNAALADQVKRRGESAAAALKAAKAEADLHAELLRIQNVLPGVTGHFGVMDDSVTKLGGQIRSLTKDLTDLERHGWTTGGVMRAFAGDLEKLGEHVDPDTIHQYAQEWAFTGPILDSVSRNTQTFGSQLSALANSLTQVAQVSGDSFGGILKGVSQVVGAADVAVKAFDSISRAATSMATNTAAAIATMATGYAALISMGVQVGIAWVNMSADVKRANAALDAFNASIFNTLTAEQKLAGGTRSLFGRTIGNDSQAVLLAVRDAYAAIGLSADQATADVERFWSSRSDRDRATIDANLDKYHQLIDAAHAMGSFTQDELQAVADKSKEVFDFMARSGEYSAEQLAKAWEDFEHKQAIALGEVDASDAVDEATEAVDALAARYKTLSDSVAKEAPEKVMGSIERAARAEMAALQRQMDAQSKSMEADAKQAASELDRALHNLDPEPIHIPIVWDVPKLPKVGGGDTGGGTDTATSRGGGTAVVMLDSRVIAEAVVPQIPGAVKRYVGR